MNGKKARALRKQLEQLKGENRLVVSGKVSKIKYIQTPSGPVATTVQRFTLVNPSKKAYRRAKKDSLK